MTPGKDKKYKNMELESELSNENLWTEDEGNWQRIKSITFGVIRSK